MTATPAARRITTGTATITPMQILDRLGLTRRVEAAQAPAPLAGGGSTSTGVLTPFPTSDHLQGVVWAELLGLENRPVDRRMAMSMPPLAKARNLLCATGGRLPLRARDRLGARDEALLAQPEPGRPAYVTWSWVIDALIWWGRAWLVVTDRYAETGRPRSVRWVPEWDATTDSTGTLTEANGVPVSPAEVIRIDGHHEGVLHFAAHSIREAEAISRATLNAARNPVPSVELHQTGGDPIPADEVDRLRKQWGRARQGEHGGVAFTNQQIEARMHGQAAEQLLLGARNAIALDLARAVGVPAWLVDATVEGSSLTYSNVPSRSRELIDFGLMPYLASIEARLSMDDVTAHGVAVRFDTSALLRGDFRDRMDAYKAAQDSGIYTTDELRQMERNA